MGKKIAIVCDWLVGIGGAERVVLEVHRMYPDAPIYTSQYDPTAIDWFADADVRTGWMQRISPRLKKFLPLLRQRYFSKLDLSEYDIIISINFGAESKAVKFRKDAVHICYCNAPTHYYWSRFDAYLADPGFPKGTNWLARLMLSVLIKPLRRWDYKAAQKPTVMIGNSTHIAAQIKKYYDREASIVFPPVDLQRFKAAKQRDKQRSGFVTVGRQTPYKRIDLAVAACTKLNVPLAVLGDGPQHDYLSSIAGPTITFVRKPSDTEIVTVLQQSEAFIFSGLDDFGIVMVEALAAGCPVIAYGEGGSKDIVLPGKTGLLFAEQTVESLSEIISSFKKTSFNETDLAAHAKNFSAEKFQQRLTEIVSRY